MQLRQIQKELGNRTICGEKKKKKDKMALILILHLYLLKQMLCNNTALWRMGGVSAVLLPRGEAEGEITLCSLIC